MTDRSRQWAIGAISLLLVSGMGATFATAQTGGACRIIDLDDAQAKGWATSLFIHDGFTGITRTFGFTSSEQIGPGEDSDGFSEPTIDSSLVTVTLLRTSTIGNVTGSPLAADQKTEAEVADVNILDGLIRSHTVRATAQSHSTDHSATVANEGSTLEEVTIDGVTYTDVAPNTIVKLPSDVGNGAFIGHGSYVALHERINDADFPDAAIPLYRANVTVRMIHVHITDYLPLPGMQRLEIIVSEAVAYTQSPTPFCGGAEFVGASAYNARVRTKLSSAGVLVGWVEIPETGGNARQQLAGTTVRNVVVNASESRAAGTVENDVVAAANAVAKTFDLCIRGDPDEPDCLVTAKLIRTDSFSRANATAAYSWGSTTIVELQVLGIDVCDELGLQEGVCKPPKNTMIEIDGIRIILNERQRDPPQAGHTGYTVRGVRVVADDIGEVIISRSYSEASFV